MISSCDSVSAASDNPSKCKVQLVEMVFDPAAVGPREAIERSIREHQTVGDSLHDSHGVNAQLSAALLVKEPTYMLLVFFVGEKL